MNAEMKVDFICHTDGKGFWSRCKAAVHIKRLVLHTYNYEGKNDSGHLKIFFDRKKWVIGEHGLIYTDKLFEKEMKQHLTNLGLSVECIGYSESGMQGRDYVDFDVDADFNEKFFELTGYGKSMVIRPKAKTSEEIAAKQQRVIEAEQKEKVQNLKDALKEYIDFEKKHEK